MIDRYTRTKMKRIWSDQNKFKAWLDVELAAVKAWEEFGRIPAGTYDRIVKKAKFTVKGIQDFEKKTNHDVVAFTTDVATYVGDDSKWIHLGLTSNDIVDTAQAMILRESSEEVIAGVENVIAELKHIAVKHRDTIVMGRTHGMHAEPTTFGAKAAIWYAEMVRNLDRLKRACDDVAVGKLSGAVGNFAHCPPEIEEKVMRELGLKPEPAASQVVQRDRHAVLMFTLAVMGGTLEKIAVTLRSLQRTEIAEVMESFVRGQKGSSAMPHKRNPITLERITGLARILRGNAIAACENQALWDERDISHSSVERVILADSLTIADYLLDKMADVLKNLNVNAAKMEENIRLTKGLYFSQTVLIKLVEKGMLRERAYELVQRNAMKTHTDDTPFYDNLLKDGEVTKMLTREELAECFSSRHFTRHTGFILERVGIIEKAAPKPAAKPEHRPIEKQHPAAKTLSQPAQQHAERRPEARREAPHRRVVETGAFQRMKDEKEQRSTQRLEDETPKPVGEPQPQPIACDDAPRRTLDSGESAPRDRAPAGDSDRRDSEQSRIRQLRRRPRRSRAQQQTPQQSQPRPSSPPARTGSTKSEPVHHPPAPQKSPEEDAQPPQLDDWRSSNSRSAVDSKFRTMPDLRHRKKR